METALESWLLLSIFVPLCNDTKERREALKFEQLCFKFKDYDEYAQLQNVTNSLCIQKTTLDQIEDLRID